MGDRGNIAVIQNKSNEQVWFYAHWSGWRMPAVVQHGLIDGKGRWTDPSYLARIIFARLVSGDSMETTGFGISGSITDNEYDIMVVDCVNQRVARVTEKSLSDNKVPKAYKCVGKTWSFEEFAELKKLPWGDLQEHYKEIGFTHPKWRLHEHTHRTK
jgi:hypothetical protein